MFDAANVARRQSLTQNNQLSSALAARSATFNAAQQTLLLTDPTNNVGPDFREKCTQLATAFIPANELSILPAVTNVDATGVVTCTVQTQACVSTTTRWQ